MPGRGLLPAALLVLAAFAVIGAACDDETVDGDGPTATFQGVAPSPTTPGDTPTSSAGSDIRNEDLTQQPGLKDFLATAGGEVRPEAIMYVDLTDDGLEDAVVPVSSGGEGGDIAVFVYGYVSGSLQELLMAQPEDTRSIDVDVEDGQLVTTEGVYGPDDPLCCPSQLRHRFYRWDGTALVVDSESEQAQTTPQPAN